MIYGLSYRRNGEKWSFTMNEIKVWNFEDSTVRTLTINNEPFFVGKDVAMILEYTNPQKAIRDHVDEEDRTVNDSFTVNGTAATLINESGLYSLILGSKLPKAKEFKRWVTSEVLPSIRKHGLYATEELLNNPDMMIAVLTELKSEREKAAKLQTAIAVQNQQLAELKPKATYYDVVLNCPDLVTITTIAKDFGWSAIKLNGFLHEPTKNTPKRATPPPAPTFLRAATGNSIRRNTHTGLKRGGSSSTICSRATTSSPWWSKTSSKP